MHELSIAQSIADIVIEQMKVHGLAKVEAIHLRVGALRGVVLESLNFGFGFVIQGTPLEGSVLRAEEIPLRGRCLACGQEFSMDVWLAECPSCREVQIEIISGKELDVVGIEGE
jgi:hydrogenase nickel incorporation protein HypA/HybF